MYALKRMIGASLIGSLLLGPTAVAEKKAPAPRKPLIQLAILLDTSGSMDGLLNQARSQLWKIVNRMALTRRKGQIPRLELALYEYGKSTAPAKDGWVRQILPLTTDLDKVSEELFALRTNGGNEHCGQAILTAVRQLEWSRNPRDFKAIFIAGNEAFTQGPVAYRQACGAAIKKWIVINTIHCGSEAQGIAGKWQDGALLADGQFLTIDQNRKVAQMSAPQDKQLARLNARLNKTYVGYGRSAKRAMNRQAKQDAQAENEGADSAAQRLEAKAGELYKSSHWDLVDAVKSKKVQLSEVKREQLPKEMQSMTFDQRKAHLDKLSKQRDQMREQIQKLIAERKTYVAQKRKAMAAEGQGTFDRVVIGVMTRQLEKKGFVAPK